MMIALRTTHQGPRFFIRKGYNKTVYFSLFVDHDKVSWSKILSRAVGFKERADAESALLEIQRRSTLKRKVSDGEIGTPYSHFYRSITKV